MPERPEDAIARNVRFTMPTATGEFWQDDADRIWREVLIPRGQGDGRVTIVVERFGPFATMVEAMRAAD